LQHFDFCSFYLEISTFRNVTLMLLLIEPHFDAESSPKLKIRHKETKEGMKEK